MGGRSTPPILKRDGGGFDAPDSYQVLTVLTTRSTLRCFSFVSPISGPDVDDGARLLAAIFAQSSGLVVFGRSSFSLNSSRHWPSAGRPVVMPFSPRRCRLSPAFGAPQRPTRYGARREVLEVQTSLSPVGVGDLEEAVLLAQAYMPRSRWRSSPRWPPRCSPRCCFFSDRDRDLRRKVLAEDLRRRRLVGRSILIFTSAGPGRRMAGSIRSCRLLAPMTMTFFSLHAVDLGQELRHDRGSRRPSCRPMPGTGRPSRRRTPRPARPRWPSLAFTKISGSCARSRHVLLSSRGP